MTEEQVSKPWYREFWAWFILAPLIATVILSTIMVVTAVRYGDDEITDDYYKKGRMINQSLEQVERAGDLGLAAEINFDLDLGDVTLVLAADKIPADSQQLTLFLDHPVSADLDEVLVLKQFAPGNFRADLDHRLANRWYLRLLPGDQSQNDGAAEDLANDADQWRLNGEIDFSYNRSVVLQAP